MKRTRSHVIALLSSVVASGALAQSSPNPGGTSTGGGAIAARESFKSDLFTGAMTESIPIVVPAGANGFQPTVELTYDSHRGNTALGRGWDIHLSAIRRDTRRVPSFSDDPLTGDRFVLDDDPLVRANNGYYRTMIDSFTRIERVDGADGKILHWIAHGADGTTSWYGFSSAKRISQSLSDPEKDGTMSWLLERVIDRNGNYIRFDYEINSNTAYLKAIAYSFRGDGGEDLGSGFPSSSTVRRIDFSNENRPDSSFAYLGGLRTDRTRRLSQIDVKVGTSLVARYDLKYENQEPSGPPPANRRSLLRRVRFYGADGSSELPGPRYRYSGRVAPAYTQGRAFSGALSAAFGLIGVNLTDPQWSLIDVNSDGVADVVYTSNSLGQSEIYLNRKGLAGEAGLHPPILNNGVLFDVPDFDRDGPSCLNPGRQRLDPACPSVSFPVEAIGDRPVAPADADAQWADYNGDGRVDILVGRYQYTSIAAPPPGVTLTAADREVLLDGQATEYKYACQNTGSNWWCAPENPPDPPNPLWPTSATGYAAIPTYPARILRCGKWAYDGAQVPSNVKLVHEFISLSYTHLVDVNGDGLADLLEHRIRPQDESISCDDYYWNYASDLNAWRGLFTIRNVYLNTGNGWAQTPDPAWSAHLSSLLSATNIFLPQLQFFDLNGDGLMDVGADANGDGAVEASSVRFNSSSSSTAWIRAADAGFNYIPANLRLADIDGGWAARPCRGEPRVQYGEHARSPSPRCTGSLLALLL